MCFLFIYLVCSQCFTSIVVIVEDLIFCNLSTITLGLKRLAEIPSFYFSNEGKGALVCP